MIISTMTKTRMSNESTARGLRSSFFIPSLKKVLDCAMTSCCFFSSSLAFSNFERSICALKGFFFGVGISILGFIYHSCRLLCDLSSVLILGDVFFVVSPV